MASTTDAGQQKTRKSVAPAVSQAVDVSLCDEKALSASGASTDTAIWISEDDTDTEDEDDDEGQDFVNSQSCCTTPTATSITDHSDSAGTKHSPTELEAAIGIDTAPAVSPARGQDNSICRHGSHVGPFADPEPTQQYPYQTSRMSAGDTTACTDASLGVSPTSPECQPCLSVPDEQLVTGATSEPGIMMMDALSDKGSSYGSQSPPTSPSMRTYNPIAASPGEMAQTPLHDSEVYMNTARDDATVEARTSSPAARLSPESQQEQDPGHASYGSSDAEFAVSEAESRSSFEAQASPPPYELPSRRSSRRRSSHAHERVQDKDGDIDTGVSGSEDGFDVLDSVCDEDYCPSPPNVQGHGSGDDSDDEHHGYKRRKVARSPHNSVHSTPTRARNSRQRRSGRRTAQLPGGHSTSVYGIESPTPSQTRPVPSEASTFLARFEEWPLRDVSLKRITEGDKTTFQLQFDWTPDPSQPNANRLVCSPHKDRRPPEFSSSAAKSSGGRWTTDEEDAVRRMRKDGCSWAEIQRALPHRSQGTIQVRYSTKLKKVDEVGH